MNHKAVAEHANNTLMLEFTEGSGEETFHHEVFGRAPVESSAHEVMHLAFIDGGACGAVRRCDVVSQHFKFRDRVCTGGFGEEQVAEDLSSITSIGTWGNHEPAGPDAA